MPAAIDLTGQTFGKLTAVARLAGRQMWSWDCACGTKAKPINSGAVKRGWVVSCGCVRNSRSAENGKKSAGPPLSNLSGRLFGRLTALRPLYRNAHKKWVWACVCACSPGIEREVVGAKLTGGHTTSCGCALAEKAVTRPKAARDKAAARRRVRLRTDARYALKNRMLSLVHARLRKRGGRKLNRLWQIVGYSPARLEARLRRTIPGGFTWADFLAGRLHIEHIVADTHFNYARETDHDFKRAWALTNLRLFPGPDNIAKGAALASPFQPSLAF